ncbi:hypothetical protein M2390_003257 [Mycetocola sp. BIGb0189]|uniref:hypothetical protein n=1 Tax=Mycetocola sp. BIGb0189 TaxID=2940604 RepID=UPI00216A677C|nr:hypothetical protein [Mycetocola sp. BIGb0189]MCS4278034.1 hypothetical protein [Mycetocola sp. BIGb0189]
MSSAQEVVGLTAWPENESEVSADALIKHAARLVLDTSARAGLLMTAAYPKVGEATRDPAAFAQWGYAINAEISVAQVAVLLVEVQKHSPKLADDLARKLWDFTQEHGLLYELAWEYLDARGVDAESVRAAAEAKAKEAPGV